MKITILLTMIALLAVPAIADAQTAGSAEDVQFRSLDFDNQILELHNFGSSSVGLDGWRFCTHDVSDGFDYTSAAGLNGVSLAAGESLSIHWNGDASGPDAINISSLGGFWVDDLSVNGVGDGISLNLYRNGSFGSSASIVDHIQYSYDGANVGGSSNPRGNVAIGAGLWSSTDDWVSVSDSTPGLTLVEDPFPGASGGTHSSSSYGISAVPEPSALIALSIGAFGIVLRRRRS